MAALKAELAHGMMGVPESSDASSNADDDEPARTDIMEVERLARHGMNSHDDPPRVADVKQKSNRGGDAGEEGEVKEDEDADGNELQKSNRGGDAGEEGEVKEDEDADGNELQKSNRGGDAGEEDEVKEDEDADGNESQKSNRDGDAGEEGEVKEDEDADGNKSVDMDLSSDTGEGVAGEHGSAPGDATALETAKMALLSRIAEDAPERADEKDREAAKLRLRMNMRATLNMVLTVAGDFYGQRDLLQFREPFVGI
ncbi:v-snare [Ophiocordyceps sinensis CO18]|nr:v-snare [Ophiocordyceps sinensis CO18]